MRAGGSGWVGVGGEGTFGTVLVQNESALLEEHRWVCSIESSGGSASQPGYVIFSVTFNSQGAGKRRQIVGPPKVRFSRQVRRKDKGTGSVRPLGGGGSLPAVVLMTREGDTSVVYLVCYNFFPSSGHSLAVWSD